MKLKTTGILFAVATLCALGVWAETASSDDAQQVAAAWLRTNAKFGSLGAVKGVLSEKDATGATLWYVVKLERGAVVVSPDTEIEPVIAVLPDSDGTIAADSPLRAILMRDLPQRIKHAAELTASRPSGARSLAAVEPSKNAAKWEKYRELAAAGNRPRPMALEPDGNPATIVRWLDGWNSSNTVIKAGGTRVQTLRFWNQTGSKDYFRDEQIFDLYTPGHFTCGCVATAGAAVMHYFRAEGGEPIERLCSVSGRDEVLKTKGGPYKWSLIDEMTLRKGEPQELSEEALDLLARVAYDCGVGCGMAYNVDGQGSSGSNSINLMNSFRDVFQMANAQLVTIDGSDYGTGVSANIPKVDYAKIIYNQIRAGAPVVLGIAGHEVVATGYGYDADETDYTYVFLGWGGVNDAWYALPVVNTKATDEGGWYVSRVLDELVTEIAPDDKFLAVVGRVVDADGEPIGNYVGLTNDLDGTAVEVDANGYWGFRIAPTEDGTGSVSIPDGTVFDYAIGTNAWTTTTNGVASSVLAAALPEAVEVCVDSTAPGTLRLYTNPEVAQRAAWKTGKLIYVVGGTDAAKVEEWIERVREDEEVEFVDFKAQYVILRVDARTYSTLITEDFQEGEFDPRFFDPSGTWTAESGLWDSAAEDWGGAAMRKPKTIKIFGERLLTSMTRKQYFYTNIVVFADKRERELPKEYLVWSVNKQSAAALASDVYPVKLTTKQGANGNVTLTAALTRPFGGEETEPGTLEAVVTNKPVASSLPTRETRYLMSAASDAAAVSNALYVANHGLILPSTTKPLTGAPGSTVWAAACERVTVDKKYVFVCTGYELYKNGSAEPETGVPEKIETVGSVKPQVGFPVVLDAADIQIKWTWKVEKCFVQTDAVNCKIDEGPQFVGANETLTITAKPVGGVKPENALTVWQGARVGEVLNATQVVVRADAPRTIVANGLDWENPVFETTLDADAFVAPVGYHVELLELAEDGKNILVVLPGDPEPEMATPEPIAFTKIEMNVDNTEVTLAFTNAVQWCNYAIFGTDTLEGGFSLEGLDPVTNFQWQVAEPTVEITLPTNGNLFWRATATEGEIP